LWIGQNSVKIERDAETWSLSVLLPYIGR
jgi:hypothetical protein